MTQTAPATARRSLDRLAGSISPESLEDLRLVVSELVTNCLRHVGRDEVGWIDMTVQSLGGAIRVEVSDPGLSWRQEPGRPRLQAEGGRGLVLVNRLAERWGHENGPHTKVWAELAIS
ncbi:MAG TPA: ATP-binding protein [Actinomycetota bacterium]